MRWFIGLILGLCLGLSGARAQVGGCLDDSTVWNTPYSQGAIQSVSYYVNILVLGVYGRAGSVDIYPGVPLSVAQGFTGLTNADSYYKSRVVGRYNEMLLLESTNCPILNENGAYLLNG